VTAQSDDERLARRGIAGDERAWRRLVDDHTPMVYSLYLVEMSVKEIAGELDIPVNTVKSHLRRGRQAMRSYLEET
jgi:predicted DNA-binding protein YlxM (UPF0122 family)